MRSLDFDSTHVCTFWSQAARLRRVRTLPVSRLPSANLARLSTLDRVLAVTLRRALQVAVHLPHRTLTSLWSRMFRLTHPGNNKGAWSADEDSRLTELVTQVGPKWSVIGKELERLPLACRDRWRSVGCAGKRTGAWDHQEEEELSKVIKEYDQETGLVRCRLSCWRAGRCLPCRSAVRSWPCRDAPVRHCCNHRREHATRAFVHDACAHRHVCKPFRRPRGCAGTVWRGGRGAYGGSTGGGRRGAG